MVRRSAALDMKTFMRTRVASNCGDGAMVIGGPEAQHPSTSAMNRLWTELAAVDDDNALWDGFHKFNIAGTSALNASAMGQRFAEILKKQEYMSAQGQGKELRASLAQHLGQRDLRVKAVCGHRKIGYICGVASRWLDNFKLEYDGYNLRMRRALDKRGAHSFQYFKEAGEAFASPSLLVFILASAAPFEEIVAPMNLRLQDAGDLPMERWPSIRKCAENLGRVAEQIRGVRRFLRCMLMVAGYIADEPGSLRKYWYCYSLSQHCNLLHTHGKWCLPAHLFPVLFEASFRGCELPLKIPTFTGNNKIYHPACQCVAPAKMPCWERRSAPPEWLDGSVIEHQSWDRLVMVWPCRSKIVAANLKEDLVASTPLDKLPRAAESSRIPSKGHRACLLSRTAVAALKEIDAGLLHAQDFWQMFRANVLDYCVGAKGVSGRMRSILDALAIAFALKDILTESKPGEVHLKALAKLYTAILPALKRRPWPPDSYEAAPKTKQWPNEKGIVIYYQRWWANVHTTARARDLPYEKFWKTVEDVTVQPLKASPALVAVWQLAKRQIVRADKEQSKKSSVKLIVWRLVDIIIGYLDSGDGDCVGRLSPSETKGAFNVAVADLLPATPIAHGCVGFGVVAMMKSQKLKGKIVRIIASSFIWNARAVAASLQHDSRFAKPAYYINRMFAFGVRLNDTSSPCERWAHELKLLWDPQRNQATSGLVHRLHGRVAGFRGDGTDEALLEVLCRELCHEKMRSHRGKALATWQRQRRREYMGNPTRVTYQGIEEDARPDTPAFSRTRKTAVCSLQSFKPEALEDADKELLLRVHRHGQQQFSAQSSPVSQMTRSAMPWCANTLQQWQRDLTSTKRDVMSSARAVGFFARVDESKLPLPTPKPQSSASSSSSSASTASSSDNHSEELEPAEVQKSSEAFGGSVSWAHKGGANRIHAEFCGGFACNSTVVTAAYQRGIARTEADAELATNAIWCKNCKNIVW